ncbi:MAG: cytochrome c biogenesis protein [Bryobacteraceae bacterium]
MKQASDDKTALPPWLFCSAAGAMLVALYLIFIWVSTEITMGIIQRIFYFHVSCAAVSFWAVFVGGIASILYMKTGDIRYDDLALAANESVVVFFTVNIVMGSMWAKRVWGIWWTWDARLTSSFLLILIYVGYLVLRNAAPMEQRARLCAVISIFGMADVPLIYMSNRLFRTQHPSPVLAGGEDSGLAPDMLLTLVVTMFALLLFWWCVIRVRRRVERLDRELQALSRSTHELVGGGNI